MDAATAANIATITAAAITVSSIPCGALALYMRFLILQHKEEMKCWINGSFMRSATVEAKLNAIESRIDEHSRRFEALER